MAEFCSPQNGACCSVGSVGPVVTPQSKKEWGAVVLLETDVSPAVFIIKLYPDTCDSDRELTVLSKSTFGLIYLWTSYRIKFKIDYCPYRHPVNWRRRSALDPQHTEALPRWYRAGWAYYYCYIRHADRKKSIAELMIFHRPEFDFCWWTSWPRFHLNRGTNARRRWQQSAPKFLNGLL